MRTDVNEPAAIRDILGDYDLIVPDGRTLLIEATTRELVSTLRARVFQLWKIAGRMKDDPSCKAHASWLKNQRRSLYRAEKTLRRIQYVMERIETIQETVFGPALARREEGMRRLRDREEK